jgi:hypothetical protein
MTSDITPAQIRAARALLAWSQQDLAKAAQVATSTVADFERNARASASASVTAFRAAFETKGISFLAGGAVDAAKMAPSIPSTGPGPPMRWSDATDIAQWAERRGGGQETLPQLISDLLLSAYGPAAHIRMPSGDSVQYAGLDGLSITPDARGDFPAGTAAWEFGTTRTGIERKAQDDYDGRTEKEVAVDRETSTFIFVTPHRWPEKDIWANKQAATGKWAAVRAFDVDNLVHWLETAPDVGLRWAGRIGRRPKGLRQLDEIFGEWSRATREPLPPALLLVDRDEEAAGLQRWLSEPASLRAIQAEAADEAMAFLYAAIDPFPEPFRKFWMTRCMAPETDEMARALVGIGANLVVVMNGGDPGLAQRLVEDGHHVLLAFGSDVGSPQEALRLPRLGRHELEQGLLQAGLAGDKAHALAAQAAGSLTVLRRLMPLAPGRAPTWAKPTRAMIAALMVGAWCDDRPADRQIVAEMAGLPYDEVVAELAPLASGFGGPLRRSGVVWKLASLRDAWLVLAPHLTQDDIKRHNALFLKVMSQEDPDFDTRLDGNWYYRVPKSEDAPVSGYVRRGLTEALIVMGCFPSAAPHIDALSVVADRAVRDLLGSASNRLWWTLRSDFRRLAEASPSVFLEVLGEAFQRDDRPLEPLFQSAEGMLSPREYHHDLLWALGMLAWSPLYLGEAALRLAELDSLSQGERKSNRPLSTLQRIFLPWTPETFASADSRRDVIGMILRRHPTVGWKLLRGLAPTGHGFALQGVKPIWRDFAPHQPEILTWQIIDDAHRLVGKALLNAVGDDLGRWLELMEHYAHLDGPWRADAVTKLALVIERSSASAVRDQLREKIRDLVAQHRDFADADWAMPTADVEALEALMVRLEPTDVAARNAWLFENRRGIRSPGLSWQDAKIQGETLQAQAVREIADQLGTAQLVEFALQARQSYAIGGAIERADLGAERFEAILAAVLESDHCNAGALARTLLGWLNQREPKAVATWFDKAVAENRSTQHLVRLALALPARPETWTKIDAAGRQVADAYWAAVSLYEIPKDVAVQPVLGRLRAEGRLSSAVCLAGQRLDEGQTIDVATLVELLQAAISIDTRSDIDNDAMDFRDRVVDIFKYLDGQAEAEDQIFALEWAWCGVLEHTDRPPRRLQKAMAESADFFMTLMKLVYLPDPDSGVVDAPEPGDPAKLAAAVDQAYHLLDGFSKVPGQNDDGVIDGPALETWIKAARGTAAEIGRLAITDTKIGRMLASAPRIEGEAWPPEPIREVFELFPSKDLESGFELGVYNRRGMTTRMPGDGGAQERVLVQRYRDDAKTASHQWPRIRRVLERIADWYERDAAREDRSAEQRDW